MQTAYQIMMVALTAMVFVNGLYKSIDDWGKLRETCEEEEIGSLQELIRNKRAWINRHLLCAVYGVILVVAIKLSPSLEEFDLLAGLFAAHIIFSMIFAFIESLLAQRITNAVQVRTVTANIPHPQSGNNLSTEGENA